MALSDRILTVPNILTLLRLLLLPVILYHMLHGNMWWALVLFVAAGATDTLDGLLARVLRQRSTFGMYLDPIADKALLSSSFLVLAIAGEVPWVVTGLVLFRDAAIILAVAVLMFTTDIRRFPPSLLGKANTVVQVAAVFVILLDGVYAGVMLGQARAVLLALTVALVFASGIHYSFRVARRVRQRRAATQPSR
jgi:cardiolipin synthase (CMP-forming)